MSLSLCSHLSPSSTQFKKSKRFPETEKAKRCLFGSLNYPTVTNFELNSPRKIKNDAL